MKTKTALPTRRRLHAAILVSSLLCVATGCADDVDVKTYDANNVAASTFYKGDDGTAVATITCKNPPVQPHYAWSGDVIPQNAATVRLKTNSVGAKTANVVATGTTADNLAFSATASRGFTVINGPRCDNPHTAADALVECGAVPGGCANNTNRIVLNLLDTASCDKHPGRTQAANCNVHDTGMGYSVKQELYSGACTFSSPAFFTWMEVYDGCGTTCDTLEIFARCKATSARCQEGNLRRTS